MIDTPERTLSTPVDKPDTANVADNSQNNDEWLEDDLLDVLQH
jgi:hypothetical protein